MTTVQAILLGLLLTWTASLFLLAWFLWKDHFDDVQDVASALRNDALVEARPRGFG
jgi:hypothetical protein